MANIIEEQRRRAGLPLGPRATLKPMVTEAPQYDLSRIAGLSQEQAAPSIGGLRRQMQQIQAGRYGSLTERGEAIRGGIRGFGEALAPIQASAVRTAQGLYQPEYAQEWRAFQDWKAEQDAIKEQATMRNRRLPSTYLSHDPTASLPDWTRAAPTRSLQPQQTSYASTGGGYSSSLLEGTGITY